MHIPQVLHSAILLIACATGAFAAPIDDSAAVESSAVSAKCTSKNIAVRKDWFVYFRSKDATLPFTTPCANNIEGDPSPRQRNLLTLMPSSV